MKSIFEIAQARTNEYETTNPKSTRSDEPLDVRLARALLDEHLQLSATQRLLVDKREEFDLLDEQCLAFIGEMMRQDRILKVIEPIGWMAMVSRNNLIKAIEDAELEIKEHRNHMLETQ